MSAGKTVVELIAEHLRIIRQSYPHEERETILMDTAEKLAVAIDKLATENTQLKTDLDAARAAPVQSGGLSEDDAQALLSKIEAIVGKVDAPAPAIPTAPSADPLTPAPAAATAEATASTATP